MRFSSYKHETLLRIPAGPCHGAEVGVWEGGLSRYLLQHRPELHLTLVDPWDVANRPVHDQTDCEIARAIVYALVEEFAGRVTIYPQTSLDAAPQVENDSLDFFFLDAIHTREAITADRDAWLPKLKPGGWYGGRDYVGRWHGNPADFRCGLAKAGSNRNWYVEPTLAGAG